MSEHREKYNATVIVTSDTCALDPSKDESGQFVVDKLVKTGLFDKVSKNIVRDDQRSITNCVKKALADANNVLIITVGGTGLCPRDVTPEATKILYEKECTGITAALHAVGLRYSAKAALSRLTSGLVGNCLIVNFPGSVKACKDCISCLLGFLEHALEQLKFDASAIARTHNQMAHHCTPLDEEPKNEAIPKDIHPMIADLMSGVIRTYKSGESSPTQNCTPSPPIENIADTTTPLIMSAKEKPIRQQSQYPILEHDEALKIMSRYSKELCPTKSKIDITDIRVLQDLVGDVLAEDVSPTKAVPKYSVSTMDGFILHVPASLAKSVAQIKTVRPLLLSEDEFWAKRKDEKYASGNFFCCRVNTGGRLPEKDFAVIPVEMTEPVCGNQLPIKEIKLNQYIRAAGSDMNQNDVIKAGTRLGPAELATILSLSHRHISVLKKPKLTIISTGDELIDPYKETNNDAGVVDINGPLLNLTFQTRGYSVENMGIVHDVPDDILMKLCQSLEKCDILLITGGASMGSKDYVKDIIEQMDGIIRFGRVNIKPGKPAAFATIDQKGKRKFIFSLPGNPVSAFVTAHVLVLPFIEHGMRNHFEPDLELSLDLVGAIILVKIASICDGDENNYYEFDGRLEFARATFHNESTEGDSIRSVVVSVKQQSSRMLTLVGCDCLIIVDPHLKGSRFQVGQTYRALVLKK